MNVGIEFGLTKLINTNNDDVLKINNLGYALIRALNNKGVKTVSFNNSTIPDVKLAKEILMVNVNATELDLLLSIDFNKNDTCVEGAYAYAVNEEDKIIAKNILSNLSSIFIDNGVRSGKGNQFFNCTNCRTIILTPYTLDSDTDVEKLNNVGIESVAENIAMSILSCIK